MPTIISMSWWTDKPNHGKYGNVQADYDKMLTITKNDPTTEVLYYETAIEAHGATKPIWGHVARMKPSDEEPVFVAK